MRLMATIAEVRVAFDRARGFVAATQLPSGDVPINFMLKITPGREQESTLCTNCFATMFACHALAEDPSPPARTIIERARPFLEGELIPPGIWNYFAEGGTPAPRDGAADVDTTAGMLSLQARMGWTRSKSCWILETNKRRDGRLYTWITPWNRRTWNPRYRYYVLRDPTWKRLGTFWHGHRWHPRDIDVVINIHVVTYLGDTAVTRGAIDWILETIDAGEEEARDKWYHDCSTFYLAQGRACARGITRVGTARPIVVERIRERSEESGRIGGTASHTAMCSSALPDLGERGLLLDRATDYLGRVQDPDGAWPGGAHVWAGFRDAGWYESRSSTTALACESLDLFLRANDG